MDVIIDSNIIRRDLKLNDKNFEILADYLNKTNSRLIIPSIVIEEVKGLYKRALIERYDEFIKCSNKLKSILITKSTPTISEIDYEKEADEYILYIHNKLGTSEDNIIYYKNDFLPDLVKRAINRKKPLDDKGQQFRDGLLWLSMLDYAENTIEKRIAFISDNPKDFSENGTKKLNQELKAEAESKQLEIIYFRELSDFAKEHASIIDFITEDWISENIDIKVIEKLLDNVIGNGQDTSVLDSVDLDMNEQTTGYLNKTDYISSELIEFFVYEKSDGVIFLNAEYEFETEYEIEIEREVERDSSRYEYNYRMNSHNDEPELDMEFVSDYSVEQEYDYKYANPIYIVKYVITIENKKVKDYQLKEWDWG